MTTQTTTSSNPRKDRDVRNFHLMFGSIFLAAILGSIFAPKSVLESYRERVDVAIQSDTFEIEGARDSKSLISRLSQPATRALVIPARPESLISETLVCTETTSGEIAVYTAKPASLDESMPHQDVSTQTSRDFCRRAFAQRP